MFDDFKSFADFIVGTILNPLVPVLVAIALLFFFYGVFLFVVSNTEGGKGTGKTYMIYGVVGLFVMVSVWGLLGILTGTIGLNVELPQFN